MLAHIGVDGLAFGAAYPGEGAFKVLLSLYVAPDVVTPFLYCGILRVAEYGFCRRDKRAAMHRIAPFLGIERHANDIDGLKPLFNLRLCALTYEYHEAWFQNFLFQHIIEPWKIGFASVMKYSEFVGYEASERRDSLLPVQYLKLPRRSLIEVDKPEWITFEQGVDNSYIFFAVIVDVFPFLLKLLTLSKDETLGQYAPSIP